MVPSSFFGSLLRSLLVPVMLMTKETLGEPANPEYVQPLAVSTIYSDYSKIYLALYEFGQSNSKSPSEILAPGDVISITEPVGAFVRQLRDDLVYYDRYTFLFPDLHAKLSDAHTSFETKAEFTNGTVTGAHTLDVDGDANMTVEEDGGLHLVIPLKVTTGNLEFGVDLNIGSFGPGKGQISGVIVGPAKYIWGIRVSPWGAIQITDLRILYKAEVEAEVTGWGSFIKWLEVLFYLGIVLLVVLVALIAACVYLIFRLRKQSAYIKSLK